MISWLLANIGTITVGLIIAVIVAAIIVKILKDKKKGKSSCDCNCGGCPMSGKCHHNS